MCCTKWAGDEVILITWLHEARRNVMKVHTGNDMSQSGDGSVRDRSPDRPNPLGLHRVKNWRWMVEVTRGAPLESD